MYSVILYHGVRGSAKCVAYIESPNNLQFVRVERFR